MPQAHQTPASRRRDWLTRGGWYLGIGGVTVGIQVLIFLALRSALGGSVANVVAVAVSTIVNTELNRKLTFADRPSPRPRRMVQNVLTIVFYSSSGFVVLGLLHATLGPTSAIVELLALGAANTIGAVARFLALRLWVFAGSTR